MAEAKKAENNQLSKLQQAAIAIVAGGKMTHTEDIVEQAAKLLRACDAFEAEAATKAQE